MKEEAHCQVKMALHHCDEHVLDEPEFKFISLVQLEEDLRDALGARFMVGGIEAGLLNPEDRRGMLPQDRKHVLFGRLRVDGNHFQIWYGGITSVNPQAIADGLEEMMDTTDDRHARSVDWLAFGRKAGKRSH